MKSNIDKMLERINNRLHWANQERSYYQGVSQAQKEIREAGAIFTGIRDKIVQEKMINLNSVIWEMTALLACYRGESHLRELEANRIIWRNSEAHRRNFKQGYDEQMEKVK